MAYRTHTLMNRSEIESRSLHYQRVRTLLDGISHHLNESDIPFPDTLAMRHSIAHTRGLLDQILANLDHQMTIEQNHHRSDSPPPARGGISIWRVLDPEA